MTTDPRPEFTREAKARWEKIPEDIREEILESVFCGNCLGGVPMALVRGRMRGDFLVLEGTCRNCGNRVARVIEPEE